MCVPGSADSDLSGPLNLLVSNANLGASLIILKFSIRLFSPTVIPMGSSQSAEKVARGVEGGKAFPTAKGMSLSYWLQGVRASPLLDHQTTEELPKAAEVVIIGSGVRLFTVAFQIFTA